MSKNQDVLWGKEESEPCECADCGRVWGSHDLGELEQLLPAAVMGSCPGCGGLCYSMPVKLKKSQE